MDVMEWMGTKDGTYNAKKRRNFCKNFRILLVYTILFTSVLYFAVFLIKVLNFHLVDKFEKRTEFILYDVSKPIPEEADELDCNLVQKQEPSYYICPSEDRKEKKSWHNTKKNLVWQTNFQFMIKDFFENHQNGTFLDLGASFGESSLFAAVLNKRAQVLAVELFPENVLRIQKAAHMNNVQHRIQVITTQISNERSSGPLSFANGFDNVQSEITLENNLFANLTSLLKSKVAFMKINMETTECETFFQSNKLFNQIDIEVILLENFRKKNNDACFKSIIISLQEMNYKAFTLPYRKHNSKQFKFVNGQNLTNFYFYFKK